MDKMTLKVEVDDLHFQYQPKVSQDACLEQIWWVQLKSVTSYHADKLKFMDGRKDGRRDGQAQATTIPLQPERPRGNKINKTNIKHQNTLDCLDQYMASNNK